MDMSITVINCASISLFERHLNKLSISQNQRPCILKKKGKERKENRDHEQILTRLDHLLNELKLFDIQNEYIHRLHDEQRILIRYEKML